MSDKEMAKDWLNEMSGYEINIIKYFENLVLTKKDLFYKNRELQQENQQLREVIEEVREYGKNCLRNMKRDTNEFSILAKQIHINYLQILDKAKDIK